MIFDEKTYWKLTTAGNKVVELINRYGMSRNRSRRNTLADENRIKFPKEYV